MHALVFWSTVHDLEQARAFLTEQSIPRLKQMPGFVAAQWVKFEAGTAVSMITFASEQAARRAVEQLMTKTPPPSVVTVNDVQIGEVVDRV